MIEYRPFTAVNKETWYDIFIQGIWVGSRRTPEQATSYVEFLLK